MILPCSSSCAVGCLNTIAKSGLSGRLNFMINPVNGTPRKTPPGGGELGLDEVGFSATRVIEGNPCHSSLFSREAFNLPVTVGIRWLKGD